MATHDDDDGEDDDDDDDGPGSGGCAKMIYYRGQSKNVNSIIN
jgi:hypothetical protein